jgi:hypothetical protein
VLLTPTWLASGQQSGMGFAWFIVHGFWFRIEQ